MKARLKYPIFQFSPKGNMVYTFWKESNITTIRQLEKEKGWKGDIIVDATGTKFVIRRSYMTRWKGIRGFTFGHTGMVYYEREYEDNPEPFPLQKLQELIAERYPKTRWFKEECWECVDEFRQAIFACKTFEEVADILMPRPQTAGERIKKWFHPTRKELKFRIGFIVFLILYLLACYWIFGWES